MLHIIFEYLYMKEDENVYINACIDNFKKRPKETGFIHELVFCYNILIE